MPFNSVPSTTTGDGELTLWVTENCSDSHCRADEAGMVATNNNNNNSELDYIALYIVALIHSHHNHTPVVLGYMCSYSCRAANLKNVPIMATMTSIDIHTS